MGKQRASFHFRRQPATLSPARSPLTGDASLSAERCEAVAAELEAIASSLGDAVTALRTLGAAGGEVKASNAVRSQAYAALFGLAHDLNRAMPALGQAVAGATQ